MRATIAATIACLTVAIVPSRAFVDVKSLQIGVKVCVLACRGASQLYWCL